MKNKYNFIGVFFVLVAVSISSLYAKELKERSFRNEAGVWVSEQRVEIAEYKLRESNIEGDIYIGRSNIEGQSSSYWIEVRHEYKFKRRNISQQDIAAAALSLQRIELNGVAINTSNQNMRVMEVVTKKDEVKETIRIEITADQFRQIATSNSWQGLIRTPLVSNDITLRMEHEVRARESLERML